MDFGEAHIDVFAVLLPISAAACETLALWHNARSTDWTDLFFPATHPLRAISQSQRLVKLSFAALKGRRCFTAGSSRYKDYHLPKTEDISPLHFTLFFDHLYGSLCIRNASSHGVWIGPGVAQSITSCLDETSVQVHDFTRLHFGRDRRFQFLLILNRPPDSDRINERIKTYFQSIGCKLSPPASTERLRHVLKRPAPTPDSGSNSTECNKRLCLDI